MEPGRGVKIAATCLTGTLLLAGCSGQSTAGAGANGPAAPAQPRNATQQGWVVTRVIDGDTFVAARANSVVKVRLIGIDTPETVKANTPVQCWGPQASQFAKDLLTGKVVLLEGDPTQSAKDQYGRRLEHVWTTTSNNAPAVNVNFYLVREGFAKADDYGRPSSYAADYAAAQQAARAQRLGLWSPATCNGNTLRPATN